PAKVLGRLQKFTDFIKHIRSIHRISLQGLLYQRFIDECHYRPQPGVHPADVARHGLGEPRLRGCTAVVASGERSAEEQPADHAAFAGCPGDAAADRASMVERRSVQTRSGPELRSI